jgi:hypothetical protein
MINNHSHEVALLTKTELEWLMRNRPLSKSFEYKNKSMIKKKVDRFLKYELPLLIQNKILDKHMIPENLHNLLLILGKEKVAGSNPAQCCVF